MLGGGVYLKIHNIYHPQTLHPQQPWIKHTRFVSLSEAVTWICCLRYFCTGSGLYWEVIGRLFPTGRRIPVPGGSRSNREGWHLCLSYCQKMLGIQGNISLHCIFNLPIGHWMKIYACPDWNFIAIAHTNDSQSGPINRLRVISVCWVNRVWFNHLSRHRFRSIKTVLIILDDRIFVTTNR